ncbi:MAG TPA: D-aminoacylase [Chloroflexota bacterium]|nr:D-aminoacylase [Chloroflexota bacterium]
MEYDVLIRGGTIYDGGGQAPYVGQVAIRGDTIAAVGPAGGAGDRGHLEIDARGLAVAPGFVNMMGKEGGLFADGRGQSDIRQGVTLEVFGEGSSLGPLNEEMRRERWRGLGQPGGADGGAWTTLGEGLDYLVRRGVSPNVASFVGAATVRRYVLGEDDVAPDPQQLQQMRRLVQQAMDEGAMGLGSALIYVPGCFASTAELCALSEVVAAAGGMYISHLRSEGDRFEEAVDELLTIASTAGCAAEIFHLKAAGKANWHKLDTVIRKIEAARAGGLPVTADMYTYAASSTGLDATMPPWVREGGHRAWVQRLRDPAIRARLEQEMTTSTAAWENRLFNVGAEHVLLVGFRNPALRHYAGKTLAQVAELRGTSPAQAAMDLVVEDDSRVGAVYFAMSEENVRRQIRLPWVSFCSDSPPLAAEGEFLNQGVHPRAYGAFARLLAKYVRDEGLIPLEEAVRRLAALPASNLKLERRGTLRAGNFADVVVFDPATVQDHATFEQPHQYATGVLHVLVNGTAVLKDGQHTGATPGRVVRGPGWKGPTPR